MAKLEKASWVAGIAGTVVALVGLIWTVWPRSSDPVPKPNIENRNGQTTSVVGSGNTTIQGSGNVVGSNNQITVTGGPDLGEDTYVITQRIADLPPGKGEKAFEGIDGPVTYCGDGWFTFRNMSQKPIELIVCEPETDNCETAAGLAPGERRKLLAKDFHEGAFDFADAENRFVVSLVIKKHCSQ